MLAKGVQSSKDLLLPVAFCNELKIKYLRFVVSLNAAFRPKNRRKAGSRCGRPYTNLPKLIRIDNVTRFPANKNPGIGRR